MAGALEGQRDFALVAGTGAGAFARFDLAVSIKEALEQFEILIVDFLHFLHTKPANFSAKVITH